MLTTTRRCNTCGVQKQLIKFPKHRQTQCKKCMYTVAKNTGRTINGLIRVMYLSQKSSSKSRNHPMPTYSFNEFTEWILSHKKYKKLHDDWVASNYDKDKKPSIDRLNDFKPYSFDNIILTTWLNNRKHQYADAKSVQGTTGLQSKPIRKYTMDDVFIKEYKSIAIAARENNIQRANIHKHLRKITLHVGGYKWKRP